MFLSLPPSSCFLQHRAKGSEDAYKEIDGIATTRYSVGGLSPYSHYDFRVAAVNTIGQGPSSEAVEARTAEQAPSSPPRQVWNVIFTVIFHPSFWNKNVI